MAVHQIPAAHTSGGTMGKGGLAAGGDGGGSGGGEGAAAVVGLDGLAIRFWPFFTIASDSTTRGDR